MLRVCTLICSLILLSVCNAYAASLKQAFSEGKYQGQLRAYNNTLALQHSTDKFGTAFGGRLAYETKAEHLWGFSLGMAYYTANDLSTNKNNAAALAPNTPTVDVDIMGEAFLRWTGYDTVFTAGRELITTPFANPSDAFVVPVTYTGYSLVNKSLPGLTVNAHHLLSIKARESQSFVDTGRYTLSRLGGTPRDTAGTSILGLTYDWQKLNLQAWYYVFPDIFNMKWFEASYAFEMGNHKPYLSGHCGKEHSQGDHLLGSIDSTLSGIKAGVKAHDADLSFALETVAQGKYLTPYSYFTDASYLNSMVSGFGNVEAGSAWKTALLYNFSSVFWSKLSYSKFAFNGGFDSSEADFDLNYKFSDDFDGLSVWFRTAYRDGKTPPAGLPDLIEYRTQIQYLF